jgi:hypothetical protein
MSLRQPVSTRQRYGLRIVATYGNWGGVPLRTASSLRQRTPELVVAMPTDVGPDRHWQCTPEGWASLTAAERATVIEQAHEAATVANGATTTITNVEPGAAGGWRWITFVTGRRDSVTLTEIVRRVEKGTWILTDQALVAALRVNHEMQA